ncbi:Uncharacterized protein TCAP_03929 [Tolypocladium capitatum]|uniref:Uncharacterized protein n=1 Tax=Tolypocladium capitatum TaxID=45235 RepID=A0A2K3QF12_9HYPO|nr:Uncharacterized protein TCAP_03929 [Tolypocladium capitatum]
MDTSYQLPFFAPESRQHRFRRHKTSNARAWSSTSIPVARVVRFNNCFVIKYGLNVSLTEGENMLFVSQTQSLSAPEVFALFSIENADG